MSIATCEPGPGVTEVVITSESLPVFKELVFRATNLWPDAPPEIKRFADILIHGKELQDYDSQNTDRRSKRYVHNHRCSCGHISGIGSNSPNPPTYPVTCLNQDIEIERTPVPGEKGQFIVKTTACKRLEMFKSATEE